MSEESNVFEVKVNHELSKQEYYKEQLGGTVPEAFFVLGGGNRKIEDSKGRISYKTSPYKGEFFPDKTGGAKARPIAALELSQFYPDAKIVTMSHRPNNLYQMESQETIPQIMPSFAKVLDEELERWGAKGEVIEDSKSTSTLTEMMEVIIMSAENNWQNTAVITNDYQIERAQKILDILNDDEKRILLKNQLQFLFKTGEETDIFNKKWQELEDAVSKFKDNNAKVVFVSAENVLRGRSSHYEALIDELTELDGYKNVVEQERIGNEKIDSGEYNFAQDSFREYMLSLK